MPLNKIPKLREPRGPIVQQVRDIFLETEYKQAPDDFYPEDIKLIENMDFLLQRYVIMQRKNVEGSVKLVSEMLKWRKEQRLRDKMERHFPQELTLAGAGFLYELDKFGNRTMYLRASMCKNCNELKAALKDFLTYQVYNIDDPVEGTTYSIIMDLTGAGLSNYDIDLMIHIVTLLKDYFPVNLDYFLAVNFPWILSAAWSLIKRLIPAEKRDAVQFINSDKIFDFVDKDKCPDFLGGTCTRPYSYANPEAPTTIEYLRQQPNAKPISKKRLREVLNLYSEALPKDQIKKLQAQIENCDEGSFCKNVDDDSNNNNNISNCNNNNNNNSEEDLKSAKRQEKQIKAKRIK